MKVFSGIQLDEYKRNSLQIDSAWNKRDFTVGVLNYLEGSTERILAIGGLRGTGKTVGILQATEGMDTCYILAQKGESETGKDYIRLLQEVPNKCVVIDEYSWIKEREELDYYLLTAVQNGKRIVITGTESITMDFLNYGPLNHRVSVLHTTMFTYEEYCRLYGLQPDKQVCVEYLMNGGLFKDYALINAETTRAYIEEAIVSNLADYLDGRISKERARTLTYSVLYKAICPSNLLTVPTLRNKKVTLDNFLEKMGINTAIEISENELRMVSEIFEQIGLIVRIPNFLKLAEPKEQYYITNPSLTCQLILYVYDLPSIENSILGHVFESSVMVQLSTNLLEDHCLYFYNNGGEEDNKELDGVVTDKKHEFAYFFECKFSASDKIHPAITLLSSYLEEHDFQDYEIEGRYLIYNGKPQVKCYDDKKLIFTSPIEYLDNYFAFEKNAKDIEGLRIKVKKKNQE